MKTTITGILIDVKNNKWKLVTIEHSLQSFYAVLNCDMIDIAVRKIGGRQYNIVCDDEGLLKADPKISAVNDMNQPMLVGNLLIVGDGRYGELASLNAEDIEYLKPYIRTRLVMYHLPPYPILHNVEYF